jgi:hypothetical protein
MFIFSLIISQTPLISTWVSKSSKVATLFETSTWDCSLPSNFFYFLRVNFSIWNLSDLCLFTAKLSLTFATIRWWSVSQSASLNDQTSCILECLHHSIRTWSIWLWVLYLRMLQCENILDVAKLTTLNPLQLLILCKLPFTTVGLKMSSLQISALKSPDKIFVWYSGN